MVLSRVVEWVREKSEKRWVKIENNMSGARLNSIVWNPPKYRVLGENTHEMTRNALKVWDLVHKQCEWEYNSPLIFLKDNDYFAPGKRTMGGTG